MILLLLMIVTSEQHANHPFAGQNTQQAALVLKPSCGHLRECNLPILIASHIGSIDVGGVEIRNEV